MKITSLLLLVSLLQINANVSSQTRISLKAENATIKQVFTEIEKISEFRFLYHDGITDLNKLITLNVNEENVLDVLEKVFNKTSSSYRVLDDNLVVIIPVSNSVQTTKVTGIITDASTNEPLPGVNVTIEGTTIGVTTDMDGKYSIDIPSQNAVLVFSYVGYSTEKIVASGQPVVNVQLIADIKSLEEVVVVGYGIQKREVVTGSVSTVKGKELLKSPAINLSNSIAGRMPGVVTMQSTGEPGYDGSKIRIRGSNTLGNNDPLIVIDGIAARTGGLERLDPADIENMSVLKDASAAIYGARAANGVFLLPQSVVKLENQLLIILLTKVLLSLQLILRWQMQHSGLQ